MLLTNLLVSSNKDFHKTVKNGKLCVVYFVYCILCALDIDMQKRIVESAKCTYLSFRYTLRLIFWVDQKLLLNLILVVILSDQFTLYQHIYVSLSVFIVCSMYIEPFALLTLCRHIQKAQPLASGKLASPYRQFWAS